MTGKAIATLLPVAALWVSVYILAARRGFTDKTYAIPLPAILANFAWEILYSTVFRHRSPAGPYVPLVWLVLDVPILMQALWYWQREFPNMRKAEFVSIVVSGLATCLGILYFAQLERNRYVTSAFPQNLMMSILFVHMLFARDDVRGQSMYIGVLKMLGTVAAIVAFVKLVPFTKLDIVTAVATLLFDFLYVILLHTKLIQLGIQPWRRL